jgi:YVTN family beta-propeller protein
MISSRDPLVRGLVKARRRSFSYIGVALLCFLLPLLLAGCLLGSNPSPPALPQLPVLKLPAQLAGYHVYVSDLETGDVAELGVYTRHVSQSVHGVGLSADGKTLYVSNVSGNTLDAFSLSDPDSFVGTAAVSHSAPTGLFPVHMVNTLDGHTIFVTNFEESSITVIDATTWKPIKTIPVAQKPHGIVLSPDGRFVYASCYGAHAIAVIDVATQTLVATIQVPVASQPYGIGISADGRFVYASDNLTGRLMVINTVTRTYVGSVQLGSHPALVARSSDGKMLYVANGGSRSVSVLDIGTNPTRPKVVATVPVQGYPHGLVVTPDGRYVVVANTLGDTLSVIDASTNHVVATISGEKYPIDVVITA